MNKFLYCGIFIILYSFIFYSPILLYPGTYVFRDIYSLYIPFEFVTRQLREFDFFPLWNPYHVLGKPIIGEPLSGILYPFNWILWLLPQPYAFNFSLFFHHIIAAAGMFGFLSLRRAAFLPALIGAVLYSFGGMLVSMDNMLNALQSAAWSSWALFAFQLLLLRRDAKSFGFLALIMALTFIGGLPEIFILENIAFVLLILEDLFFLKRETKKNLLLLVLANVSALCLSGILLLPFVEYLLASSRAAGVDINQILRFSVPFGDIADFFIKRNLFQENGLFVPTESAPETPWAITKYIGPFALAAFLSLQGKSRNYKIFAFAIFCVSLIAAFGSNIPGYRSLVSIVPVFKALRYPEKFLFITHGLLCIGAAFSINALKAKVKNLNLLQAFILLIICVDLYRVNSGIHPLMEWSEIASPPAAYSHVKTEIRPFRIYTNSYQEGPINSFKDIVAQKKGLLDQQTANFFDLENINTPISVNLQDHEKLNVLISQLPKDQAINLLRSLNVAFITSRKELLGYSGLELQLSPQAQDQAFLYKVIDPLPRVLVPDSITFAADSNKALEYVSQNAAALPGRSVIVNGQAINNLPEQIRGKASITDYQPDKIEITAAMETRGIVVLSDTFANGWQVAVDGKPGEILRANYFVRGVYLEPGEHALIFTYQPATFTAGAALTLISLLILVVVIVFL